MQLASTKMEYMCWTLKLRLSGSKLALLARRDAELDELGRSEREQSHKA